MDPTWPDMSLQITKMRPVDGQYRAEETNVQPGGTNMRFTDNQYVT